MFYGILESKNYIGNKSVCVVVSSVLGKLKTHLQAGSPNVKLMQIPAMLVWCDVPNRAEPGHYRIVEKGQ